MYAYHTTDYVNYKLAIAKTQSVSALNELNNAIQQSKSLNANEPWELYRLIMQRKQYLEKEITK